MYKNKLSIVLYFIILFINLTTYICFNLVFVSSFSLCIYFTSFSRLNKRLAFFKLLKVPETSSTQARILFKLLNGQSLGSFLTSYSINKWVIFQQVLRSSGQEIVRKPQHIIDKTGRPSKIHCKNPIESQAQGTRLILSLSITGTLCCVQSSASRD